MTDLGNLTTDAADAWRAGAAWGQRQGMDEIERLTAEVAALRLTLGGRTYSADVPEPIGCPCPGACAQVAEIQRLRARVAELEEQG